MPLSTCDIQLEMIIKLIKSI